jgi:hypothetical protein
VAQRYAVGIILHLQVESGLVIGLFVLFNDAVLATEEKVISTWRSEIENVRLRLSDS